MTVSLIPVIMTKVKHAEPDSPIAIFKAANGRLDALFAKTVFTSKRIEDGDPDLIGVYDRNTGLQWLRRKLEKLSPVSIPVPKDEGEK